MAIRIFEHRAGHGAFRPDKQIELRIFAQSFCAEARELVEDFQGGGRIEFVLARDVGLHEGNAECSCRLANLHHLESIGEKTNHSGHRESEIVVRPHAVEFCF